MKHQAGIYTKTHKQSYIQILQNKALEKLSDRVNNKIILIFGILRKSTKYSEFITEIFSEMNYPEQKSATNQYVWKDEH